MNNIMRLAMIDLEESYKGNLELGYKKDEAIKVSLKDIIDLYSLTVRESAQLKEQLKEMNPMIGITLSTTTYKDFDEYLKFTNTDPQEFDDKVEEGFIQELTLGTYNGASNTFTPNNPTNENIKNAIYRYLVETCQESTDNDTEQLSQYVFIIQDTKEIYLEV